MALLYIRLLKSMQGAANAAALLNKLLILQQSKK